MRLYYAPGTISVAVAIALHEAGLPFDSQRVDFKSGEQTKPGYLAINPKGRVPTLDVAGELLTETGAILEFIASRAPAANLIPNDALAAAKMRSVMFYLASTMHVNHAHGVRATRWADAPESHADMVSKVPETMSQSAQYIEDHCLEGPYILGDTVSIADPYTFVVCSWLKPDKVDVAAFPKVAAFMDLMRSRASVQKVIADGMLPA